MTFNPLEIIDRIRCWWRRKKHYKLLQRQDPTYVHTWDRYARQWRREQFTNLPGAIGWANKVSYYGACSQGRTYIECDGEIFAARETNCMPRGFCKDRDASRDVSVEIFSQDNSKDNN